LDEQQAFNLLNQSLKEYYDAVKIYPKRLVLHKTSNFNQDEIYGFTQAARELHINQIDLVSIQTSDIRLYRSGDYPPMRGTHFTMTDNHHVLYTRGSVPYYETYPGRYIPRAIEIKLAAYDESPNVICDEILALTKMNWNNTQFDRQMPITIECARNVGEILKYLGEDEQMQLKYSFYM
jgi:argonaute-like protein implicated in RNA metabolism and viral defense